MTKKLLVLAVVLTLLAPCFAQQKKAKTAKAPKTEVKKTAKTAKATKTAKAAKETNVTNADDQMLPKVYDEDRDAMEMIEMGLEESRASGRTLICQVGGNWCPWCLRLSALVHQDDTLAPLVNEHYVYVHINIPREKEKRNYDVIKRLGNPGRFGYPVFVILNQEGQVIQTQRTDVFEEGKGYNVAKLKEFFQQWTRKAIDEIK